ncbi:MAG: hypothetical protein K6E50_09485 [Lachnospiraceae bacterium]|nr:hypothetical protein [Lachnospiraceae bacterium]
MFEGMPVQLKYQCDERMDGVKIYNYFNPPDLSMVKEERDEALRLLLIGIVAIVVSIAIKIIFHGFPWWLMLLGILGGGIGIAIFVLARKHADRIEAELKTREVSDDEFDAMEAEVLKGVMQRGLEKMNLDEDEVKEAPPLILHQYREGGKEKRGEDGRLRCSEHVSTVFYFTQDTLFIYRYIFSMVDTVTKEEKRTIFYSDIVSVAETELNMGKARQDESWTLKELKISLSGGQTGSYMFMASPETDRRINGMQSLFRNKKRN